MLHTRFRRTAPKLLAEGGYLRRGGAKAENRHSWSAMTVLLLDVINHVSTLCLLIRLSPLLQTLPRHHLPHLLRRRPLPVPVLALRRVLDRP